MGVSHTGQRAEDQSILGRVVEKSIDEGQGRPDSKTEEAAHGERGPLKTQDPDLARASSRKAGHKNGNRHRLGETERRGPVVSQEPRLIETAAALGWAQGRFGLVDVIDTRRNR
jgi:hypothetical protein